MPSELAALGRPHEVTATWGTPNAQATGATPPRGGSPRRPERSLPTLVSVRARGRGSVTSCDPTLRWEPRAGRFLRPQLEAEVGELWLFPC